LRWFPNATQEKFEKTVCFSFLALGII